MMFRHDVTLVRYLNSVEKKDSFGKRFLSLKFEDPLEEKNLQPKKENAWSNTVFCTILLTYYIPPFYNSS